MLNRVSSVSPVDQANDKPGFDLREGVGFVWRQWKFISYIVGIFLLAATVYVWTETPRYTASAQVLLEPQREKTAKDEAILSDASLDFSMVESQLAIIRSSVFLQRVVEKERLVADPEFGSGPSLGPRPSTTLFATLRSYFPGGAVISEEATKPALSDGGPTPADVVRSIQALKGAILVGRAGQGYVLNISVTSVDAARAARIANAVADSYVVEKLDARFEAAKRASAWLSDRLVDLRKQLRESEEAVAKFRSENGFVQSGANVTLNQQQLSELNAKLVTARSEMAEKKARVDLLRSIEEKGGNVLSMPDLPNSPAIATLRQ